MRRVMVITNYFRRGRPFQSRHLLPLRQTDGTDETPLSSGIPGMLDTVFVDDRYIATADGFNIMSFGFDPNTGVTKLVATPTPEPASTGLLTTALIGFLGLGYT